MLPSPLLRGKPGAGCQTISGIVLSSRRPDVKSAGAAPAFSQNPGVIADAERALREVFGLDDFRPGQAEVVAAMLARRDVLSVAPTGSGKSISYWVPAVVDGGLTMVVSPLIALMKDQVDRLTERGVPARSSTRRWSGQSRSIDFAKQSPANTGSCFSRPSD